MTAKGRPSDFIPPDSYSRPGAKRNFRNGGANPPGCRAAPPGGPHLFGNFILAIALSPGVSQLARISRRVVARASRRCVSGPPQPQLSLPYTGETPVPLLFGCHFAALSPFVVSKPALHDAGFSRFI